MLVPKVLGVYMYSGTIPYYTILYYTILGLYLSDVIIIDGCCSIVVQILCTYPSVLKGMELFNHYLLQEGHVSYQEGWRGTFKCSAARTGQVKMECANQQFKR